MNEEDHRCHIVKLIPYEHQVGGHVNLLSYDKTTICKPLNEQECKAYEYLPKQLSEFLPQFCGVVQVHFEKCGDNILCFALPPDCSYCKDKKSFRGYLLATNALDLNCCEIKEDNDTNKWKLKRSRSTSEDALYRLWQRNYKSGEKLEKFIKLECISKNFKLPCVMDLKMGTRGHGDFVSKEKRERKEQRIYNSTSRTLGVRMCGVQCYDLSTQQYKFTNKYEGRRFSDDDFKNCLKEFLFNGVSYRTDLLPPLIQKLDTLSKQLLNMEGYRFYCSSLLIIYDADMSLFQENNTAENSVPSIELRMIDFANARLKEEETNMHTGPDDGYIFGVTSLISIFKEFQSSLSI